MRKNDYGFARNYKAITSEFLEILQEMFSWYHM